MLYINNNKIHLIIKNKSKTKKKYEKIMSNKWFFLFPSKKINLQLFIYSWDLYYLVGNLKREESYGMVLNWFCNICLYMF